MATVKRSAYTASAANALSTELNSLANNSWTALGTEIDNTSDLALYMDVYVSLASWTSGSGLPYVMLAMVQTLDGTTYPDWSSGAVTPPQAALVTGIDVKVSNTGAQKLQVVRFIEIPPAKFKLALQNVTGGALAASGSTVAYRTHSMQVA